MRQNIDERIREQPYRAAAKDARVGSFHLDKEGELLYGYFVARRDRSASFQFERIYG